MLFHIQSWGEKMLIFLFELKIKPKNFKSWNVVSYFLLGILLMCALSKPILEKVYWELKKFWQLFQFPIKLFQKWIC